LDLFFSFLDGNSDLNPVLADYFSEILKFFFKQNKEKVY